MTTTSDLICAGAATKAHCTSEHCAHAKGLYLQLPKLQVDLLHQARDAQQWALALETLRFPDDETLPDDVTYLNRACPKLRPSAGYTFLVLDWYDYAELDEWTVDVKARKAKRCILELLHEFEDPVIPLAEPVKEVWISMIYDGRDELRRVRLSVEVSLLVVNTLVSEYGNGAPMSEDSGDGTVEPISYGRETNTDLPLLKRRDAAEEDMSSDPDASDEEDMASDDSAPASSPRLSSHLAPWAPEAPPRSGPTQHISPAMGELNVGLIPNGRRRWIRRRR